MCDKSLINYRSLSWVVLCIAIIYLPLENMLHNVNILSSFYINN